jgi:two-component system chemotaxis sensor kinase CheA
MEDIGDGKVRLFRLNDGLHEIGYAFSEVIDFATIDHDIIHSERPGEISGVSLVNNEPAELIDAHWLFANHPAAAAPRSEQLVCLIPDWDPWMQNMLRPLVEAAGYRVVDDAENEKADVVIACLGEELPEHAGHKTIWLRSEPEVANTKDFSIYRYDRAGLLTALKSVGAGRGK